MDWLTFIVEIIKALAWPSAVTLIAFNFKNEISKLLLRISKLKHKDTEIEFAEGVEKLIEENKEQGQKLSPPDETDPLHTQYETLTRLAEISPRAAVIEAFRVIEVAAFDALQEHKMPQIRNPVKALSILRENMILSEQDYRQFELLRHLRNKAAHDEEFSLKGMPIEAYIDIALTVAHHINRANNKKSGK